MLETCNPSASTAGCEAVVKKDCQWSGWTSSKCSSTCGRGSYYKKRTIKVPSAFGGKPCDGNETEVHECKDLKPCPTPTPVNCLLDKWSDWSACSTCGGQRKRYRNIAKAPEHGGDECKETETSETEGCLGKEFCTKTYCNWAGWGDWGGCSRKCGTGKRMRRRTLAESSTPPADDTSSSGSSKSNNAKSQRLYSTYQELEKLLQEKSGTHWQELGMSFGCGCLSFVVFFTAIRYGSARMRSVSPAEEGPDGDALWSQRGASDRGYNQLIANEDIPNEDSSAVYE